MPIGHYEDTDDYLRRMSRRAKKMQEGVKLKIKRLPETNEWKVCWYEDGVLNEDRSYYTDDQEDALMTARAMANEAYQMGYRNVEVFS